MVEIRFEPGAYKYLKKIKDKNLKVYFNKSFKCISSNPYIGEHKNGDMTGIFCYDFIYRKTCYEIAYMIFEEKTKFVVVILAGTRENFYERLKRYMKRKYII